MGTHTIESPEINSDAKPSARTIPLVASLMRTEAQPSIGSMVGVLKKVILAHFEEEAVLGVGRQDHSYAILNAFESHGVEVKANCYVHLKRGVLTHRSTLHSADYFNEVEKDIEVCHLQTKRFRIELLTKGIIYILIIKIHINKYDTYTAAMIAKWKTDGEDDFAEWFKSTHLHLKWDNWFIGAPGMPGVSVQTNDLEGLNG